MQKLTIYFFSLIVAALLLTSCGPTTYVMKEPEFKDVVITGLSKGTNIIEVSDIYDNQLSKNNSYWIVVRSEKKYQIGKIDMVSGAVTDLKPLDVYSNDKPLYWTNLNENKMSTGAKLLGACMSSTAIGGTKEDYSFIAEKYFDNNDQHLVHVEYSIKESGRKDLYGGGTEEITWGRKLKFLIGDKILEPLSEFGHIHIFSSNRNILKSRFYPIGERQYISIQPNEPKGTNKIAIIYYDLGRDKSSWGAQYKLPKNYVDCCVSQDGKIVGIIIGKEGNYILRQYSSENMIKNVKALKK